MKKSSDEATRTGMEPGNLRKIKAADSGHQFNRFHNSK